MKAIFTAMRFYFAKPTIILVLIIVGIIISIKVFKNFINRNKKIDDDTKKLKSSKNKSKIMGATLIINAIFGLLFTFSLMLAYASPMMFDSPGSGAMEFSEVFFLSIFSFPISILISIITSSISLFLLNLYKVALIFSLLPMLNVIMVIFILFIS